MLLPVLQSGLGNPGIALGPVGAIAGEQAHTVVLPNYQHPIIPVVLYFVDPVRLRRDLLARISWQRASWPCTPARQPPFSRPRVGLSFGLQYLTPRIAAS